MNNNLPNVRNLLALSIGAIIGVAIAYFFALNIKLVAGFCAAITLGLAILTDKNKTPKERYVIGGVFLATMVIFAISNYSLFNSY